MEKSESDGRLRACAVSYLNARPLIHALDEFEGHVGRYQTRITSLTSVLASSVAPEGVADRVFSTAWGAALKFRRGFDQ